MTTYSEAPSYHIGLMANDTTDCPDDECNSRGHCPACRHRFRWLDGSPLAADGHGYQHWGPIMPEQGGRFCVFAFFTANADYWVNILCMSHKSAYICRKGTFN